MAKTAEELTLEITKLLERNGGAMGIGEFLLNVRSIVVSPNLLIEALQRLEEDGSISLEEDKISLEQDRIQPAFQYA